jgi:hypothetical protein
MFDLWEQCIVARDGATADMYHVATDRDLYPREVGDKDENSQNGQTNDKQP